MWISVALAGPARKPLLLDLTAMSGRGVMELKRLWDASRPILHIYCSGEYAEDGLEGLKELLELADGNGIGVTMYEADWPLDNESEPLPESISRRIVLNMLNERVDRLSRNEDRSVLEIAERALCLIVLYVWSKGDRQRATELIEEYGVAHAFSPEERRYLDNAEPSPEADRHYTWSIEAAAVLLRELGLYELPPLTEQVDVGRIVEIVKGKNAAQLAQAAGEVDLDEDEDEDDDDPSADLYDLHWSIRDARLNGRPDPEGFDPDVVIERRHAFEWLATRASWDDVELST